MNDCVLDLETCGTNLDSAIVGIGVVEFDLARGTVGRSFFRAINLGDAVNNHGAKIDPATVTWWLSQSKPAQAAIVTNCYSVRQALLDTAQFMGECGPDLKVWGNAPAFDCGMLSHLYKHLGMEVPWKFWNERCVRTIKGLFPMVEAPEFVGEKHNAVDDCKQAIAHILKIREYVRGWKK